MSRTKLVFPKAEPLFTTNIAVRITDINYGNHVGNDSLLSIIHEARMQVLSANGMSELNVGGASLIMGESVVCYKGEGFYGDVFEIHIWADDVSTATFDLLYEIKTKRDGMEVLIAEAKTVMICFDYEARKTKPLTEALKRVLV